MRSRIHFVYFFCGWLVFTGLMLFMPQPLAAQYVGGNGAVLSAACQGNTSQPSQPVYRGGNGAVAASVCLDGRMVTIDFVTVSFDYDNTPKVPVITTTPDGQDVVFTYDGSPVAPAAPGTYNVIAKVTTDGMYGEATAVMAIIDRRVFETTTTAKTYDEVANTASTVTVPAMKIAYVKQESAATGTALGTSWDAAFPSLDDALHFAGTQAEGMEIRVAAATYTGAFQLPANVQLVGGYHATSAGTGGIPDPAMNVTVLDGQAAARVVTQTTANTIPSRIEGFTIQRGAAADSAGGVLLHENGLITHCVVTGNTAPCGAGVVLRHNSYMLNTLVHGNTSTTTGSAVLLLSGAVAGHVTVVDNFGTGITNVAGSVRYSISWNNTTNTSGAGFTACNEDNDPQFFGGANVSKAYQLTENSPCIDRAASAAGVDMMGNPRTMGAQSDMGAYELYCINTSSSLTDTDRPKNNTVVLLVDPSAMLTVNTSAAVVVDRLVLLSDDNNTASVVDNNGRLQAANLTLQKTMAAGKWYLLSLPYNVNLPAGITDINGNALSVGTHAAIDIRSYDGLERAQQNRNYLSGSPYWKPVFTQLNANEGYIMATASAQTVRINAATAYSEPQAAPHVTLLANNVMNAAYFSDKENAGWNLRGIPFLSAYDFSHISKPFMIYTYNGSTWKVRESWAGNVTLPAFAGYFMQTTTLKASETVLFPLSGKQAPSNSPKGGGWSAHEASSSHPLFGRGLGGGLSPDINITISGNGYEDETKIRIDADASLNYEPNKDALKMMSLDPAPPQLYTVGPGGYGYAINVRPDDRKAIPLTVHIGKAGEYTISLDNAPLSGDYTHVYLVDKLFNQRVDLTAGYYVFTATRVEMYDNRFEIVLHDDTANPSAPETPDAADAPGADCPEVGIHINGGLLYMDNVQLPATVALYDLQGNVLVSRRVYFEHDFIDLKDDHGVLILKITTPCRSQLLKFIRP